MEDSKEIQIRLLADGDGDVLRSVDPDVFDNPVVERLADEFLQDPRHHIVVATEETVVVGFASGIDYVHPDKPPELFVLEVGVAETHQRRGIASKLIRRLLSHARSIGCKNAWVATETTNHAARALYESLSGQEEADRAVVYNFPLASGS
ncbi:MAG: GNAT family N-acetyltransferase [Rhodothermales bacterium]|nr:GNAT family N-acetyltransferase [Rhodothermales bacterium]MBO6778242.1 GNAT family N-acetyltransferase [Rhodothermales bacterium]